jgi:hypothetical protein
MNYEILMDVVAYALSFLMGYMFCNKIQRCRLFTCQHTKEIGTLMLEIKCIMEENESLTRNLRWSEQREALSIQYGNEQHEINSLLRIRINEFKEKVKNGN